MTVLWGEMLLVNPGAVAPGTHFARQALCSVARLLICADGAVTVEHVNLDHPLAMFVPPVDLDAGFRAGLDQVSQSIIAADILPLVESIGTLFRPSGLDREDADTVRAVFRRLAYPCWAGERDLITRADMEAALRNELPADLWRRTMDVIREGAPKDESLPA
jgi:hypothetical protein